MKTYRFSTRITSQGTIEIPGIPELLEKEVEVTIVPTEKDGGRSNSARLFVEKWGGFLKETDPDGAKFEYLSEKYK